MELFVKVCFWMFLVEAITKLINLGIGNYPRIVKRWIDAGDVAIGVPLIVWAWYLTFGN